MIGGEQSSFRTADTARKIATSAIGEAHRLPVISVSGRLESVGYKLSAPGSWDENAQALCGAGRLLLPSNAPWVDGPGGESFDRSATSTPHRFQVQNAPCKTYLMGAACSRCYADVGSAGTLSLRTLNVFHPGTLRYVASLSTK